MRTYLSHILYPQLYPHFLSILSLSFNNSLSSKCLLMYIAKTKNCVSLMYTTMKLILKINKKKFLNFLPYSLLLPTKILNVFLSFHKFTTQCSLIFPKVYNIRNLKKKTSLLTIYYTYTCFKISAYLLKNYLS